MSNNRPIRVRFAPSPTGFLHVGGARTALFNWLYARSQNGVFVLRIEDTDQQRSTEQSYEAILSGMRWLGLDWDEGPVTGGPHGPYLQSERLPLYRQELDRLQENGQAYPCFCTREELEAGKAAVVAAGRQPGCVSACRDLEPDGRAGREAEGRQPAWRLRFPGEGVTFWYDVISGKREFPNESLSDRVIFKADGFPTYNFAAVVDDHLMGITHVLRGDDHLSNTPFQLLIYDALGFDRPKIGHMPMILGSDRKRLSKRHGATSVEEFQKLGILPDALFNYLSLLGWSPGGTADEVMTRQQIVKKFSLKKVGSAAAAFDYDKLNHINSVHLKRLPQPEKADLARAVLAERGWEFDPAWSIPGPADPDRYLERILGLLGNRFSSLLRLPDQLGFFFSEDYNVEPDAAAEHLAGAAAAGRLAKLADSLQRTGSAADAVTAAEFEQCVRDTAEELGVDASDLIHPCRVALTGQSRSAGIFEVMELIGLPRVLARLRRAASSETQP